METETASEQQKACRQCALAIPANALLCSTCGSYQDWRGWLAVSSTILALLVALISVTTAAVPAIVQAFEQEESSVRVSNVVLRDMRLSAIAANAGRRPATIAEVAIHSDRVVLVASPQVREDTYLPSGAKQVVFEVQPKMSAAAARDLADLPEGKVQPDGTRRITLEDVGQIEFFVTNSDGSGSAYRFPSL